MKARRVLNSGDPRGDDYRNAEEWVEDIRSRLSHIRGELEDIGRIEAMMEHDRLCKNVAGSLTLALIALYRFCDDSDTRSFSARADHADELWADVRRNPVKYVIQDGESWDWRPLDIYKRGGRRNETTEDISTN